MIYYVINWCNTNKFSYGWQKRQHRIRAATLPINTLIRWKCASSSHFDWSLNIAFTFRIFFSPLKREHVKMNVKIQRDDQWSSIGHRRIQMEIHNLHHPLHGLYVCVCVLDRDDINWSDQNSKYAVQIIFKHVGNRSRIFFVCCV